MMAKIVKGQKFKGVVNYILDKYKGAELLDSNGVRLKSPETIIQSFVSKAEMNPRLKNPVCHISLDFSSQDCDKHNSELMVKVSREYMKQMEISDTQYIIGRSSQQGTSASRDQLICMVDSDIQIRWNPEYPSPKWNICIF